VVMMMTTTTTTTTLMLETVLYTVLDSLLIVDESLVKLKWIGLLKGGGFLKLLVHYTNVCFSLSGCYMFQLVAILRELSELFGCELPQDGDQPKLVRAWWGEI